MKYRIMRLLFFTVFFLVIDLYFYQAVLAASRDWSPLWKGVMRIGFWVPTVISLSVIAWWTFGSVYNLSTSARNFLITGIFAAYFPKVLAILILFVEDLYRVVRWAFSYAGV